MNRTTSYLGLALCSPSSRAEWDVVVMHHIRIRAQLTDEEHKAILEFLKSSN